MKKILSLTLTLMLILSTFICANVVTVSADELDSVSHLTYTKSSNSVTVTGIEYGYEAEEIEIPSEIDGLPVRQISGTFNNAGYLTSVIIPDSVTSFATGTFVLAENLVSITVSENNQNFSSQDGILLNKDKTELISVPRKRQDCTIPGSVTTLDSYAFYRCDSLVSVTVTEDNETFSSQDGVLFNKDKTELLFIPQQKDGEYVVPDGVIKIDYNSNNKITKISIPESVTTIEMNALSAFDNLVEINVSEDNENFSSLDGVLFNKDKTELIQYPQGKKGKYIMPDGVTTIGCKAFQGSRSTSIKVSNGVTTIEQGAFGYCTNLTDIDLPDGITTIPAKTFYQCFYLQSITLPKEITEIIDSAFAHCINLKSVTLYNKVNTISKYAFFSCDSLTDVYFYGTKEEWDNITIGQFNGPFNNATIHYLGEENGFTYSITNNEATITGLADGYNPVDLVFPETIKGYPVTAIGGDTCYKNNKSVTIPTSIKKIGYSVFGSSDFVSNSSLTDVYYGGTVKEFLSITFDKKNNNLFKTTLHLGDESTYEFDEVTSKFNLKFSNGEVAVVGLMDDHLKIAEIPEEILGDKVTIIGANAFSSSLYLEEVVLPGSIKVIEKEAFTNCIKLKSINIPDGVTKIGRDAFAFCSAFESISLPNTITEIENDAFISCVNLVSIELPENMTTIISGLFYHCRSLKSVTFSNKITNIRGAFANCEKLTDVYYYGTEEEWNKIDIESPDAVNKALTTATIHFLGEEEIDPSLFVYEPIGETEARILFLNDNFESTVINVPETIDGRTVIGIGHDLFGNQMRPNLKRVSLPATVTELPGGAFYKCTGLTKISIPGVTKINESAFLGCSALKEINLPEDLEVIDQRAFEGCSTLKTITIPDSVTSIGDYAFKDCGNLEEVNLPTHLIEFGEGAFYGCLALKDIYLSDELTSISKGLFCNCSSLNQMQLSDNITSIGDSAFVGCKLFTEMNLPKNLEYLGKAAYAETSISEAKFLDNTTSVPVGHFADCDNLESVTIPDGVKSIGNYAFSHCDNLTEIHIPYSVDSIGSEAFEDCNSLTDVYFDGPQRAWNHISFGYHNDPLLRANLHFNEEPKDVDLAVTRVSVSQSTITDGDDVNLYCMIRNNGTEATQKGIKIDFYYNGILFDTVYETASIPAGGFKVIESEKAKSTYVGVHSVKAIVNSDDNQSETDKSNNTLKSRLAVAEFE
jgi:hypothetical protein